MRNIIYILIIMSCCILDTAAHDTNAAFFKFLQFENEVIVEAEFPWTIRKSLFEHDKNLNKEGITDQDIQNSFLKYIQTFLVLKDNKGNSFKLNALKKLPAKGHTHQVDYQIVFSGKNLTSVENRIMFNVISKQVNNNFIEIEGSKRNFKTTVEKPVFLLSEPPPPFNYLWLLWLLPILFLLFYFRKSKKITS